MSSKELILIVLAIIVAGCIIAGAIFLTTDTKPIVNNTTAVNNTTNITGNMTNTTQETDNSDNQKSSDTTSKQSTNKESSDGFYQELPDGSYVYKTYEQYEYERTHDYNPDLPGVQNMYVVE